MKNYLENLKAVHDMGDFRNTFTNNEPIGFAEKLNKGFNKFGSSIHPIVKSHPITKKKFIYINPGFTNHIVGLNSTDSNNLLNYLFTFIHFLFDSLGSIVRSALCGHVSCIELVILSRAWKSRHVHSLLNICDNFSTIHFNPHPK